MAGTRWETLYRNLLRQLKDQGQITEPHRGQARELVGHSFVLTDPRDRCLLSPTRLFNVFQVIGHWLWIMAGRMDLASIEYYNPRAQDFSTDLRKLDGAYGPRLFGQGALNQVPRIIEMLKERKSTRRAIASIYLPSFDSYRTVMQGREDEVPCTIALQFLPRDGRLLMIGYMRSQDVYGLLPYDLFIFTLLQEYVAVSVGAELGEYHHHSSSFHYYLDREHLVEKVLQETVSPAMPMPAMPEGPQDQYLKKVWELEEAIRVIALGHERIPGKSEFNPRDFLDEADELPDFWKAAVQSLVAWAAFRLQHQKTLRRLHDEMEKPFDTYVERALSIVTERTAPSLEFFIKQRAPNNP